MPKENGKGGPPQDVLDHLLEVHSKNPSLENFLSSGIGSLYATSQNSALTGRTPSYGNEPWLFDGTVLTLIADLTPGPDSSYVAPNYTVIDGVLYFTSHFFTGYYAILSYDLGSSELQEVAQFGFSGTTPGYTGFIEAGGKIYFVAATDSSDRQLWSYDPTSGDVGPAVDINPTGSDLVSGHQAYPVAIGDKLYFSADDGEHGFEVWSFDAISGEAEMLADINPNGDSLHSFTWGLMPVDGVLYFAANDGVHGTELWRHDPGTGITELVEDLAPGPTSAWQQFTGPAFVYEGRIYDDVYIPGEGLELGIFDTATDTFITHIIYPGSDQSSAPGWNSNFTAIDGTVYFGARSPEAGTYELYSYDPATDSVTRHPLTNDGELIYGIGYIGEFEGKVVFNGTDTLIGSELRIYDPATGDVDSFDFREGSGGSSVRYLGSVNGMFVVSAQFGDGLGAQMFVSDGLPETLEDFTLVDADGEDFRVTSAFLTVFDDVA